MKSCQPFVILLLVIFLITLQFNPGYAQTPDTETNTTKVFLPVVAGSGAEADTLTAQLVPNQYSVVLQDEMVTSASVAGIAGELTTMYGATVRQTYDTALHGFTINLPTAVITEALTALREDTRIESIEQDQVITVIPIEETQSDLAQAKATAGVADTTQPNAPWSLDRIDQHHPPLNSQYTYSNTGAGVKVYVIDSGIRASHTEFEGRVIDGYDTIDGALPADDCFGHGTHVAAIVGGKTYGVAKEVALVSVRVLDCQGQATVSEVVAGVDWVTQQRQTDPQGAMVANMSLGGPISPALDEAVANSIAAGITYVVAAGNNYGMSACNLSPARVPTAITTGATMKLFDLRAFYSNTGSCLDLFAPGSSIPSAWFTGDDAIETLSGTSMASPHVAGAAALYLQSYPNAAPGAVAAAVLANATPNVVFLAGTGSPNRLLFVLQTQ